MDQSQVRPVRMLSRGSKLALALVGLIWIFGGYLYVAPLQLITKEGSNVSCGSAANPRAEPLIVLACSDWPLERRWQVVAVFGAGVIVAVAGLAAYGTTVRIEAAVPADLAADPNLSQPVPPQVHDE